VKGVASTLVLDLGIAIEGRESCELPEVLLCQTRFYHVSIDGNTAARPVPSKFD
jgi:hypothetical protein